MHQAHPKLGWLTSTWKLQFSYIYSKPIIMTCASDKHYQTLRIHESMSALFPVCYKHACAYGGSCMEEQDRSYYCLCHPGYKGVTWKRYPIQKGRGSSFTVIKLPSPLEPKRQKPLSSPHSPKHLSPQHMITPYPFYFFPLNKKEPHIK